MDRRDLLKSTGLMLLAGGNEAPATRAGRANPGSTAFITEWESALAHARKLNAIAWVEAAWLPAGDRPVVLVKDNIAVAGLPMTGGTPFFRHVVPRRDAAAVRLLRDAGAVAPVKTTLHELAAGITGNNPFSGPARNPYRPDHITGGSSSGSAAALAVGLGDLSLVTDTGGSARIPAALCGLFGFRPSTGRYPSDGLLACSPSRDTIGIMARSLEKFGGRMRSCPASRAILLRRGR